MPRTCLIVFFFFTFSLRVAASPLPHPARDSDRVKLWLEEGMRYLEDDRDWRDTLAKLCRQSIQIGGSSTDPRTKCLSAELPALYYFNYDQGKLGDYYAVPCLRFLDSTADYAAAFRLCDHILKFAGGYHTEHRLAVSYGVKSIGFAKKIRSDQLLSSYTLVIQNYYYNGDLYSALFYAHEALDLIERSGTVTADDHWIYYTTAEIYREMGRLDLSLEYCRRGIANINFLLHRPGNTSHNLNRLKSGLMRSEAQALSLSGRAGQALDSLDAFEKEALGPDHFFAPIVFLAKAECYMALRNYPEANKYFTASLAREGKPETGDSLRIYLPLARFWVEQREFDKARPFLERLLLASVNSITPYKLREIYHLVYRTDSAAGHLMSALQYLRLYNVLNDSLFGMAKNGQFEARQLQYATEAKDRDLKAQQQRIGSLVKDQELQKTQLHDSQLLQNAVAAGGILLLLLLGLLYNRYRLKRRSHFFLETQQRIVQEKHTLLQITVAEKDGLLVEKEALLVEKDDLILEKEWLIKEVHHRVKNNLQIVVSLLSMASRYIDNEAAIGSIRESQHRMQAMSLIHQKLYKSEDGMGSVDMTDYVRELIAYLDSNFNASRRIHFKLEVSPISLSPAVAVPVGLLLNEAITNTIKHAFPGMNKGTIRVMLSPVDGSTLQLSISDDGVGLPDGLRENKRKSMGMNLMKAFAKQLHGRFEINSGEGVSITVQFPNS